MRTDFEKLYTNRCLLTILSVLLHASIFLPSVYNYTTYYYVCQ
uniref:Uncharacterized protein n=1 Tax=Siphoviridae sp. ctES717 TaxID=2827564 RepID=A0A8S5RRW0_9CAUD|nr:MAG TPA: hypothetical protein [Siphoviridae sp. ctES717]